MKVLLYLTIFLTFIGYHSNAQEADSLKPEDILNMSLDEILNVKINVSSTIPLDIFKTPSTVSVIDRETIDLYNFTSIEDAIRIISGVEILQTVIDRNVPTIRGILQNFYANKILIMIDNIPVWQPTYGNGTLDRLGINDVERIEVLRGPASVLYGTNAYSGVINIIRRKPETSKVFAKIEGGYPNYGSSSVNITNQKGDLSWNISGSSYYEKREPYIFKGSADTFKINGHTIYDNDTIQHQSYLYKNDTSYYFNEEYRKYSINFGVKYKGHNLYFNNFVNSFLLPGINASYNTGANKPLHDKGTLLSYTYNHSLNDNIHIRLNGHYEYFHRNFMLSQAYSESARFSSNRISGSAKINYHYSENLQIESGVDILQGHNIEHNIVSNAQNIVIHKNIDSEENIVESSLFGQINYKKAWFSILAGMRYTYNRNIKNNISARVASLFSINDDNNIKIILGQSFRSPNFLELYFDHWTVVGNSDLEPEKCNSVELMYLTKGDHFFTQITAYHSQYSNLIQRIRTSTNLTDPATYRNLSAFDGYGIELEIKYQNNDIFNWNLSYNFMDGDGQKAQSNFMHVPKHTLSIGANKPIGNFFASSNAYMYSETEGPWEEISSQAMLDAHFGYKHSWSKEGRVSHTISIRNLTKSDMLIPEYIRRRPGVNSLPTTAYGRRIQYSLKFIF